MPDDRVRLSKRLSYVLRHHPESIGVELDPQGWVALSELVTSLNAAPAATGPVTIAAIEQVAATSDKRRFELRDGRIRAAQGHSVAVDLGLEAVVPPELLYHGTVERSLPSIRRAGLVPGERTHVHLSVDRATATAVGARRGRPVVLVVRAAELHGTGTTFHVAANGVWLTAHVPPDFIDFP